MNQKREKPQGEASMEAWSTKNGGGENGEDDGRLPSFMQT